MFDGMINVYKEKGFTSHDVVAKLRGILHQKKIGHTGTLDPDAVGVLPVCLGKGTKLCDMITDHDKTYEAVMLLGRVTDTQDTSGQTLEEREVSVTEAEVMQAIDTFVGHYDQLPPMYSAIKVDGKKLYELARQGKEVERKTRPVTIHEIEVLAMDLPRVRMRVNCSKGTYIRTLCHDIGLKLGCGACMEELIRTKVGRFEIGQALRLPEIESLAKQGEEIVRSHMLTVEEMLADLESARTVDALSDKLLINGNPLKKRQVMLTDSTDGPLDQAQYRVYTSEGSFIGIYAYDGQSRLYKNIKMF